MEKNMNIADVGFKFDVGIDYDGDFDGGTYEVVFKYLSAFGHGEIDTETKMTLRQHDIDDIYAGLVKLSKAFKPHISEVY